MSLVAIGLDNPKNGKNVGSAIRAAHAYRANMVALGGPRPRKMVLKGMYTDTSKGFRHLPVLFADDVMQLVPHKAVPVAVDLVEDATPLPWFEHPKQAFYIFGAEDATLGERILSRCAYKVYVPTAYCMNLAATVNVLLYDRLSKTGEWKEKP